ncbi:MAG: glycosyltransferase [bacterium]|nr:glycosyltransferase [bacterium]
MKLALCFLTYNEAECLKKILPGLDTSMFDEVFAVDGGSTDGTLDIYQQKNIRVIPQKSRGRGEAFKLAEKSTDADAVVYFSPDGNEDSADFPKFRILLEQGADIVIASRMMRGAINEEDISWWRPRKWVNNAFNLAANILWNRSGKYITDSINGFRALRRGIIERLGQDAIGYTIEYQNTIRAMKAGLKIVEFPTHEGQRLAGGTQAQSLKVGLQFVKCLFREIGLSFSKNRFLLLLAASAVFVGLVYVLPPLLIERKILSQGDSFLLVQPETYRDEFFSYVPRDREVFDGHFPAAGPYANDNPQTLMNQFPPLIFSAFIYLFGGNVESGYLALQFVFSALAFLLFFSLGSAMMKSRLWGVLLGFIGVFTYLAQQIFYYAYRNPLAIYFNNFIPFVRTPISKMPLARIEDPLITLPVFLAVLIAFYSFWNKPRRSTAIITALLSGLLAYTYLHHWLMMMVIIGSVFILVLLTRRHDKALIKNFLILFSVAGVVVLPYLINNFSFLATHGKDFALRLGLEQGRGHIWQMIFETPIVFDHIIYSILFAVVYLVYFRWRPDRKKGLFMAGLTLSMFLVWQIPLILGSFPQISHFIKSVSLVALLIIVNLIYDVLVGLGKRGRLAALALGISLIAGLAGKKLVNTLIFINPPAGIVKEYSFPKEMLDSWSWIDANLGKEPKIVSSSLVTSLYLAGNTKARPYLPTGFISALPTTELEKRFMLVNKLFGVTPEMLSRRIKDFDDDFSDICAGEECFKASHFNFTKNRWYLAEHGWYMTEMASSPEKAIAGYRKMKASWKDTNADYVYYGPWEKQFGAARLSSDPNLKQVFKNSLVEIYQIQR